MSRAPFRHTLGFSYAAECIYRARERSVMCSLEPSYRETPQEFRRNYSFLPVFRTNTRRPTT